MSHNAFTQIGTIGIVAILARSVILHSALGLRLSAALALHLRAPESAKSKLARNNTE